MSSSIAELKEELQSLNLSTSTPGVVGENRMEALRMRLEMHKAKGLMDGGLSAAAAANATNAFPSLDHLSMSELKSRLKQLSGDTSTPGLSGEERREELSRRLVQAICGGTPTQENDDVMDELIAGTDSSMADDSPREAEEEEFRFSGGQEGRGRRPFASHMAPLSGLKSYSTIEEEFRDLEIEVPEVAAAPPARMVEAKRRAATSVAAAAAAAAGPRGSPQAAAATEAVPEVAPVADIGEIKKKIKRLSNKRAVAVASRMSGNGKDTLLKEHEKTMHQADAEMNRVRLLKGRGGNSTSSVLVEGGAMMSHDALIEYLTEIKAENKFRIKERKTRIKEEEDNNPEHSAAEEKSLNEQVIDANLQRGRTRRRMDEARNLDKKVEADKKHPLTVAQLAANQATPSKVAPGATGTVGARKFAKPKKKDGTESIHDQRLAGLEKESDAEKNHLAQLLADLDEQSKAWQPADLDLEEPLKAASPTKGTAAGRAAATVAATAAATAAAKKRASVAAEKAQRFAPVFDPNDDVAKPSPPSSAGNRLKAALVAAPRVADKKEEDEDESDDDSDDDDDDEGATPREGRPDSAKSGASHPGVKSHPDRLDADADFGIDLDGADLDADLDEPIMGLDSVEPGRARLGLEGDDVGFRVGRMAAGLDLSVANGPRPSSVPSSVPSTAHSTKSSKSGKSDKSSGSSDSDSESDDEKIDSRYGRDGRPSEMKADPGATPARPIRRVPAPPPGPLERLDMPVIEKANLTLDTGGDAALTAPFTPTNPVTPMVESDQRSSSSSRVKDGGSMASRMRATLVPNPSESDDSDDSDKPMPVAQLIQQRMKEAMMPVSSDDDDDNHEEDGDGDDDDGPGFTPQGRPGHTPKFSTSGKSPKQQPPPPEQPQARLGNKAAASRMDARLNASMMPDPSDSDNGDNDDDDDDDDGDNTKLESRVPGPPKEPNPLTLLRGTVVTAATNKLATVDADGHKIIPPPNEVDPEGNVIVPPPLCSPPAVPGPPSEPHPMADRPELFSPPDRTKSEMSGFTSSMTSALTGTESGTGSSEAVTEAEAAAASGRSKVTRPTALRATGLGGLSSDSDSDMEGHPDRTPQRVPGAPAGPYPADRDFAIIVGADSDDESDGDDDKYPSPLPPGVVVAGPTGRRAPPPSSPPAGRKAGPAPDALAPPPAKPKAAAAGHRGPPTESPTQYAKPSVTMTATRPTGGRRPPPSTSPTPPVDHLKGPGGRGEEAGNVSPPDSPQPSEKSEDLEDDDLTGFDREREDSSPEALPGQKGEKKAGDWADNESFGSQSEEEEDFDEGAYNYELKENTEPPHSPVRMAAQLTASGTTPAIDRALAAASADRSERAAAALPQSAPQTPTASRLMSHPLVAKVAASPDDDGENSDADSAAAYEEHDEDYTAARLRTLRKEAKGWAHVSNMDQAESTFQEALMLDPLDIRTLESFASFLNRKRGDIARAESFYRRALQVSVPGLLEEIAHREKTPTSPSTSTPAKARPDFVAPSPEDIAKRAPPPKDGPKISVRSIISLLLTFATFLSRAKGDIEATLLVYRRAIKVAPKDGQALAAFAHFLAEEGAGYNVVSPANSPGVSGNADQRATDEAAGLFQEALKACPGNPLVALWYAKFLKKRKKFGEADLMYQVALQKASPDAVRRCDSSAGGDKSIRATVMCNYGSFLYRTRGNMKAGHDMLEQGIKEFPKHRGLVKAHRDFLKAADL